MGKRSSIDGIIGHLRRRGADVPTGDDLHDDLTLLVRRYDEVRSLGQGYGSVGLSPYMKSLLRVTGVEPHAALAERAEARTTVVAGG